MFWYGEIFNLCGVYLLLRFMVCRSHVLNYDSVTICDGMEKVVRCPNKENIHVLQGFYGKWKNHDCNGIKIDPSNAHTCSKDRKETTEKVRNSCQGQNQCTFIADKEIYGDPCPDSNAYLYVTFFCMESGKQADHQKDKSNQETVTVTTHGYLVSERKHIPPTVSPTPKINEIMNSNHNKPLIEKPNLATQEGESKITIPKNEPNPSSGLASKLAQIQLERLAVKTVQTTTTPIRDERKQITNPQPTFRPANDSIESSIRREEIFDRMLRSSTICNGLSKLIACLPEEAVKVNGAFYGKKTGKDCNGDLPFKDDSPTCSALDARSNVQNLCNGRQTCLLFADENIYGKALCPNVNKYLHIDYVCLPKSKVTNILAKKSMPIPMGAIDEDAVSRSKDPSQGKQNLTVQVCNGERHAISCRRDVGMLVLSAFYGKLNGRDCRGELGYRDDIPNCINPRALDSVRFLCENRKSCELASEKELFGDDVCPGVNKYLKVTYQC